MNEYLSLYLCWIYPCISTLPNSPIKSYNWMRSTTTTVNIKSFSVIPLSFRLTCSSLKFVDASLQTFVLQKIWNIYHLKSSICINPTQHSAILLLHGTWHRVKLYISTKHWDCRKRAHLIKSAAHFFVITLEWLGQGIEPCTLDFWLQSQRITLLHHITLHVGSSWLKANLSGQAILHLLCYVFLAWWTALKQILT